jgi:hypothetical protein
MLNYKQRKSGTKEIMMNLKKRSHEVNKDDIRVYTVYNKLPFKK